VTRDSRACSGVGVMRHERVGERWRSLGWASLGCLLLGCSQTPPQNVQEAVCQPLSGSGDPLRLPMSSNPAADGKIRAFLAAVRGLADTAEQAEAITVRACQRIATDLGAPAPAPQPVAMNASSPGIAPGSVSAEQACSQALQQIQALVGNEPIPIAVSAPICEPDYVLLGRCEALCSAQSADATCATLCRANAAAYGVCRAAKVALPELTGQAERWVLLGSTLGRNLPWLLHAQMALGRRLTEHVKALVAAGAELPKSLKEAGPVGIGCLAAGAIEIADASQRFQAASSAGTGLLNRLGLAQNPNAMAQNQPPPSAGPQPMPAAGPPPPPPPAPAPFSPFPQPSPAGAP
jgi:hypothetical protein